MPVQAAAALGLLMVTAELEVKAIRLMGVLAAVGVGKVEMVHHFCTLAVAGYLMVEPEAEMLAVAEAAVSQQDQKVPEQITAATVVQEQLLAAKALSM